MTIRLSTRIAALASGTATLIFLSAPAWSQASRTWVSGVGDDVNPCSRTAPCKTFAGAISKTAAGGEINCLDPGGFGAVTITKSLSIICDFTEAGVLASVGSSGVIVNAGANDVVFLSGLDFHGSGTGANGVRILAGGVVHIQNSTIRAFRGANGRGVSFTPSGATQLTITNTTISDNGSGAAGGGIHVQPTGTGTARLALESVVLQHNANNALAVDTTGATDVAPVSVLIDDSQFIGGTNGISLVTAAGTNAQVMLTNSVIALNSGAGILANGSGVRLRAASNSITANATGLSIASGANVNSYGNNRLDGNGTDGAFNGTIIPNK